MYKFITLIIFNILFSDYGGGYTGSNLRYSSNAREFSLAGAIIADKTQNFYALSNPALLQLAKNNYIGISVQSMSLDRSIQSFSFSKKLPPNAGLGLAIIRAGTDNIIGRDWNNNETELFSSKETTGIISFGVNFNSNFALGINMKILFNSIYNYNGNGISGDIGMIYKINHYLHLGVLISNINAHYNWKILINDDEHSYREDFPQEYLLGISYSGIKNTILLFQEDIMISPNDDVNYRTRLGYEYTLKNKIKIRFGLKQSNGTIMENSSINKIFFKPSIGFGSPINIWNNNIIFFDYALDPGTSNEGISHLFSFIFKLKK